MMPTAIANNNTDQLMRFELPQASLEFLMLFLHQHLLIHKTAYVVAQQRLG